MRGFSIILRLTCSCCYLLTCLLLILKTNCYANNILSSDKDKIFVGIDGEERRDDFSTSYRVQRMLSNLGNDGVRKDEINLDISYDEEDEEDDEDYLEPNTTEKGRFLGSPCEKTCNPNLRHVVCDEVTGRCECEKLYPVRLGLSKGCAKPKKLGEQCFYRATCTFVDQHATCMQILHNAVCDCDEGYHKVTISRPNKRIFCAEDLVTISTDLPTLLGVAAGITVLGGLICFVLKLSNPTEYNRPDRYIGHHGPAMLFASDTGIPMTIARRPSSRTSQRSDPGPFGRRTSSGGSGRGPIVPVASRAGAARAAAILLISCHLPDDGNKHRRTLSDVAEGSNSIGSRRPSLASIHSSISSARSYSAKRLERERNEKEQRLALQELKMAKQREQEVQEMQGSATPGLRTPHSTDDLLPSVDKGKEVYQNKTATTSTNEDISCASTSTARTENVLSIIIERSGAVPTEGIPCDTTETAFTTPIAHTSACNMNKN